MPRYAELVYYGFWFSPEREMLQAMIDKSQERVEGTVRLKLYKGNVIVTGRKSPKSLYSDSLVTFEDDRGAYDQKDAAGLHPPQCPAAAHPGRPPTEFPVMNLRNIAIIAHVDHGKTTLIDRLLAQSGAFRENQRVAERAMDSNDLERERGITILAKVTSILWKGSRINIVDTPGHADFGGEVERILNMVDGAVLLVDAAEGPMPQTKFVLQKALKIGLKPIVAVNKIDKHDERHVEVVNEVFDLFAALDATDDQLDFPILYGSAKLGWMAPSASGPRSDMAPLFDLVLRHVPPPAVEPPPFRMLATTIEANPYLGRVLTGRIRAGSIRANQTGQGAVARRQGRRAGPDLQGPGLSRPRAPAHRGGLRRRHRGHFRPRRGHRLRHHCRSRGRGPDRRPAHRSADPCHAFPHQ